MYRNIFEIYIDINRCQLYKKFNPFQAVDPAETPPDGKNLANTIQSPSWQGRRQYPAGPTVGSGRPIFADLDRADSYQSWRLSEFVDYPASSAPK
jgi:hypothetical protein